MILILKEKVMSLRDFNNVKIAVQREMAQTPLASFRAWYTDYTKTGNFKINQVYRKVLERHLYIVD